MGKVSTAASRNRLCIYLLVEKLTRCMFVKNQRGRNEYGTRKDY